MMNVLSDIAFLVRHLRLLHKRQWVERYLPYLNR